MNGEHGVGAARLTVLPLLVAAIYAEECEGGVDRLLIQAACHGGINRHPRGAVPFVRFVASVERKVPDRLEAPTRSGGLQIRRGILDRAGDPVDQEIRDHGIEARETSCVLVVSVGGEEISRPRMCVGRREKQPVGADPGP